MPFQDVSNSPMFEQNNWQKCINIDPASELLFSVWSDQPLRRMMGEQLFRQWVSLQQLSSSEPLTRTGEHPSRMWVASPVLGQIRATDGNGWPSIQYVSRISSAWAVQNHWQERVTTHPGCESSLQCLSRSEPLTRMYEHSSREWVIFQCLNRSEPLTWMGEHPSREWVASPVLEQIRATD